MNIILCSLYYERKRVTGANKRFDFFGKILSEKHKVSVTVVVRDGEVPDWADNVIVLPRYESLPTPFRRLAYCFHLTRFFSKQTGIVVNDFMPVPFWFTKKNTYFQLVHDIRNFTDYNRAGLRKVSSAIQKIQWGKVPAILTVSEFTKKQLVNYCKINPEKIVVSYNGIETEERIPKVRDIDFLYIATFEKRKNHINLVKAFSAYVENINPQACMYLIGRDLGYKQHVLDLVAELHLTSSIIFIEAIDECGLNEIYERTCCFVSPSLYEGFGMPIIEAMYFGCNVACSDIDVFHEIAGKYATYFDPCDVNSIVNGMNHSILKSNDSVEGISYVKSKFTWDSIATDFLKLVGE